MWFGLFCSYGILSFWGNARPSIFRNPKAHWSHDYATFLYAPMDLVWHRQPAALCYGFDVALFYLFVYLLFLPFFLSCWKCVREMTVEHWAVTWVVEWMRSAFGAILVYWIFCYDIIVANQIWLHRSSCIIWFELNHVLYGNSTDMSCYSFVMLRGYTCVSEPRQFLTRR